MHEIIHINNTDVSFEVMNGQVFADSLNVAEVFGKHHKNIIRDVKRFPDDDFARLNFELGSYMDPNNQERPMYKMTRDGFTILVMGFTGAKAYEWKKQFIQAFNLMEEKISGMSMPALPDMSEMNRRMLEIQARMTHLYEDREELKQSLGRAEMQMHRINCFLENQPLDKEQLYRLREACEHQGRVLANLHDVRSDVAIATVFRSLNSWFGVRSYHELERSRYEDALDYIKTVTLQ